MGTMKFPPPPPVDAVKFCNYVTASPTPFHAVANLKSRLLASGFKALSERKLDQSLLKPGGRFFYTRDQSSIVAFTLPLKPGPETAISFAAGHLDSPCLRVRPVSKKQKEGYLQVGVELYGGGIWHSWFDRDLSIAGRVIVSTPSSSSGENYTSKLVKIDRPILRIPTLAIHLDGTANDSFKFNKESEFVPILGLVTEVLNESGGKSKTGSETPVPFSRNEGGQDEADVAKMTERHHPMLLAVLADELGCYVGDIQDFELCLFDTQPSQVGGMSNEFIFSPRIDNLMTCFASIEGLCEAVEAESSTETADGETNVRCVMLFDNEENGSLNNSGAESNMLPSFAEMIASLPFFQGKGSYHLLANSYLVSADMGHAINPNYTNKAEPNHAPKLNGGVVIKTHAKQRYASNAQTTFLARRVAKDANVPLQEFEVRNDTPCGTTIGPILSPHVRTVDIGLSQLSMHSIRETAGSADVRHYVQFFKTYFERFAEIDRDLKVD